MSNDRPFGFGFDPEDFDRVIREAGDGLRDVMGRLLGADRPGWGALFDDLGQRDKPRGKPEPETAGEAGDGVWAIYTVDQAGGAHIEEVYRSELDALRAYKDNSDPTRNVRFLPYGIAVSVLDAAGNEPQAEPKDEPQ